MNESSKYINFFYGACSPNAGYGILILEAFEITHDTPQSIGLPWTGVNPSQRPLPDNTQHSEQTDIHAAGGIRTHNLSR